MPGIWKADEAFTGWAAGAGCSAGAAGSTGASIAAGASGITGDGWIVDLNPGSYKLVLSIENSPIEAVNASLTVNKGESIESTFIFLHLT